MGGVAKEKRPLKRFVENKADSVRSLIIVSLVAAGAPWAMNFHPLDRLISVRHGDEFCTGQAEVIQVAFYLRLDFRTGPGFTVGAQNVERWDIRHQRFPYLGFAEDVLCRR